jgi:hypothetical protein
MTLAPGGHHTCTLSAAGGAACWGYNDYGQTSVPSIATSDQVAIAAGVLHTCTLSAAGGAACWGRNNYGQTSVPSIATSGQVAIAAGWYHTCTLSAAGGAACWGYNGDGQTSVPSIATFGQVAIAAGGYHTCTLSAAGGAACWGNTGNGRTSVPVTYAFTGIALPCRLASLSIPSMTPSAAPTPGFACFASLYRSLPRMDLVGSPIGSTSWVFSEESCRVACCAAAPGCQGYSFAINDPAARFLNTPSACILFSNVTQLIPSSFASSGVLLSSL